MAQPNLTKILFVLIWLRAKSGIFSISTKDRGIMEKEGLIAPNATFTFTRHQNEEKKRIDQYLAQQFPLYSRSFFKKLIEEGFVTINGLPVTKQGTLTNPLDIIHVRFPSERLIETETIQARNLNIQVLYEHEHFFIISKPAGLIVHPPHTKSTAVTLMDWLLVYHNDLKDVGYVDRPGIVHRLDKETSGIMVIPRTNKAHTIFSDQFKNHEMKKKYLAIVQGHPEQMGTISLSVGRHPIHKTKMHAFQEQEAITYRGPKRSAITHYKVLEYYAQSALVEVSPVTGRTHQIRVHFAAIGHPLIGDPVYGCKSKKIKRHALHAHSLTFHFMHIPYTFHASMPEDFQTLIAQEKQESDLAYMN